MAQSDKMDTIANNIANADTPGYSGRDFDFKRAMSDAIGDGQGVRLSTSPGTGLASDGTTHGRHIPLPNTNGSTAAGKPHLDYTVQSQPAMDGNSVDLDRERANFVDNSVRYEATLRFKIGRAHV